MVGLAPSIIPNADPARKWVYVTPRFKAIQADLDLRQPEMDDGMTKLRGVVTSLNRAFRKESTVDHYLLAGSWGKNTAIRPPMDIDMFFKLPWDVYNQFDAYHGNKLSQLLQHVRQALAVTYPQTGIRGDGQVVVVGFNTVTIEVVPAFSLSGSYLICDTNDGGSWKWVDPDSEFGELDRADFAYNGNVRKLTRIIKQWKRHCNVPIKSFHIEHLVRETLEKMTTATAMNSGSTG